MKKNQLERCGFILTGACALLVIILVLAILVMVSAKGISPFTSGQAGILSVLFGSVWSPHDVGPDGSWYAGILPMLVGSLATTLLSCVFVLPFALGCALFMVEIYPEFGRRVLQPALETLVGIPSVVFGLLGLTIIVPVIRGVSGGTGFGILAGSIVLAVMVLPTVATLSADAIRSVPDSYRDGSYGLGATRAQTIRRVVLKSARPGILTAVVLGMARAFGEALAVQMVIGGATVVPTSLTTPASTLTSVLTNSMGNEPLGTFQSDVLFTLALVLLIVSLVFIVLIRLIGSRSSERSQKGRA